MHFIDFLESIFKKHANIGFLYEHDGEKYHGLTYWESREKIFAVVDALKENGIKKGDRVVIFGENSSIWVFTQLAAFYIGAVVIPITIANDDEVVISQIKHSDPSLVFASERQLNRGCIRDLTNDGFNIMSLQELDRRSINGKISQEKIDDILQKTKSLEDDDVCVICYTSGTSGRPKGVMLTYGNLMAHMLSYISLSVYKDSKYAEHVLVVLPMSHVFVFATLLSYFEVGIASYLIQEGDNVSQTMMNMQSNIFEVCPIAIDATPSILMKFREKIEKSMARQSKAVQMLFRLSQSVTLSYKEHYRNKRWVLSGLLFPFVALSDRVFFRKIKKEFGGKLKLFAVGGSSLSVKLNAFFESINIDIVNCWGMTESAGGNFFSYCENYRLGSVGQGRGEGRVKIVDQELKELPNCQQGEILYKGPMLMKGYYKDAEATAEAFTEDGWLHTGDMGYIDKDGFLFVNGRAKSMLVNSNSEKYCSEEMENAIVADSPFVMQAMLFNEGNEHTMAIIVPEIQYARKQNVNLRDLIKESLIKVKEDNNFPDKWFPQNFIIAREPFTIANKQLSASMKLVRRNIIDAYRKDIDNLQSNIYNA